MISRLLGAFLAFVEAPGGAHGAAAVLPLGKAGQRLATLGPDGFLEAPAKLGFRSHGIDVGNDLLVGVCGVDRLGLLDGMPLV